MVSEKEGFARIVTDLHSALQNRRLIRECLETFAKYAESMSSNRDIEGCNTEYLNLKHVLYRWTMPPGVLAHFRTVLSSLCLLISSINSQ